MKEYIFKPQGVCSRQIRFVLEDDIISNVEFTGGCHGNLKSIASLVKGMKAEDVIEKLSGITCGFKKTSCGDQFSLALKEALSKSE
ncbi:MAG: TIGR03905 family TSCPD domain-containing protein [Firmicutes bacterium]|nr:TIGR03905 family TSCPD domain-containing protein [Bacillota bacterium]